VTVVRRAGADWPAWGLISVGAGLRLARFVDGRALWADEAYLALNLLQRSFAGLLEPLEAHPSAPLAYLLLEKLAVTLFGTSEYALRSVPLLAGLACLPWFYVLCRRCLTRGEALLALALFALAEPLVFYASELKPYAFDVLAAIALLWAALHAFEGSLRPGRVAALGALGVVAMGFSHTTIFVCAGIASVGVVGLWLGGRHREGVYLAAVGALWVLAFALDWVFVLGEASDDDALRRYWAAAFLPLPPRSQAHLVWYWKSFLGYFEDPVGLRLQAVAGLAALLGGIALFRERPLSAALVVAPVLPLLVASALERYPTATHTPRAYPYFGRLILFTVPIAFVLIAAGVGAAYRWRWVAGRIAGVLLGAALLLSSAGMAVTRLVDPPRLQELRDVLEFVSPRVRADDVLLVDYLAMPALRYYSDRVGLSRSLSVQEIGRIDPPAAYRGRLDALPPESRVWFLLVWNSNWPRSGPSRRQERVLLALLERRGTRRDAFQRPGAAAYLYELEPQAGRGDPRR
jgi:hypothetical protein